MQSEHLDPAQTMNSATSRRFNLPGCLIALVLATPLVGQESTAVNSKQIHHGSLSATFLDNSNSPAELSGIASLFHEQTADFDAYDPDTPGASAGLNFEHIISGHASRHNKFTPRLGRYTLHPASDDKSVTLSRRAVDSPWRVSSSLTYQVKDPHYIDFDFRCSPQDASLFGDRNYALFFFANYMNDVDDVALHFRGHQSADSPETWIAANAPAGPHDWNGGGTYRALAADGLEYDDDVSFRLNSWSYDWPRIAQPFYYGRASRGMTLILMFDRLYSEQDQIRFSLFKFKVPKHPRPAWDFQYVINQVQTGVEYGFRGRLVWKKFVSQEDCQAEYERWATELRVKDARQRDQRINQLKKLGATVFEKNHQVVEVSANRSSITDEDLALLSEFRSMTDLSLEQTKIGDAGMAQLGNLQRLEWLNLYRTKVSDTGLTSISRLSRLEHLPIGETDVTDAGLVQIGKMKQLLYLGLRGNDVSDKGLKELRSLVRLTGLHLGETNVTDQGLAQLTGMSKLRQLWLDQTEISDKSIPVLATLKSLRELHITETRISDEGAARLGQIMPRCHIHHRAR